MSPDPLQAERFLRLLYSGAPRGYLTLLHKGASGMACNFIDILSLTMDQIAARACQIATAADVYFGVGLRGDKLEAGKRGDASSIIMLPGLYADIDIRHADAHVQQNRPPNEDAAMEVLCSSGMEPSMIVHSGHGLHGYLLFEKPLGIDANNRQTVQRTAAALHSINAAHAQRRGWAIDNVADLARILRPAGTINWKDPQNPKPVTFEYTGRRYSLEEIEQHIAEQLAAGSRGFVGFGGFVPPPDPDFAAGETPVMQEGSGDDRLQDDVGNQEFPPARIEPIMTGCPWMRHCHDDAETLREPEWYGMLGIIGRCADGERLAHEWSKPHPKYTHREADRKLRHALTDAGPVTCARVAEETGGTYCQGCLCAGLIKSPITIGTVDTSPMDLAPDPANAPLLPPETTDSVGRVAPAPGAPLPPVQEPVPENASAPAAPTTTPVPWVQGQWPQPKPLSTTLPPVVAFDPDLLPVAFRAYALDVAERMQVPLDFPAAALLVALAGATGRRARIRPKRHDRDWVVVPNLWGGIVSRPGNLKSPLISAVLRPLRELEKAAIAEHKEQMGAYELELEAWEARKKAAFKAGDAFEEPKPERPPGTRYIINDATIEKLHVILEDNPQGVLLFRDELAGWFAGLDTKGRERERPFFLEGWNGDGGYTIDRIGRGTLYVEYVCISVFGGIQPARLQGYLTDAVLGGGGDDGLAQRLQVILWPDQETDFRNVDREPDRVAATAVDAVFQRVTKMSPAEPFATRFSDDAQELFDDWRGELETRVRKGKLPRFLESHLAKYRSLMPSIALLLHIADGSEGAEVPLAQAQRAADWCSYLESHALRVYSCVTGFAERAAATLGERISKGALGTRFSARDVQTHGWTNLTKHEAVLLALGVLQDAGWIRAVPRPKLPVGGRPTQDYVVNPAVHHD
ncbi:MAG: DUF3987 domain-containing protein [Acidobacteria bacterium]|nr:DUF3987 domain-containing protein [Acidobacteriota bacterium]